MSKKLGSVLVVALTLAAVLPQGAAAGAPIGVSPGGSDGFVEVESRCPTFSWSEVPGVSGYELVVYRVDPDILVLTAEELRQLSPDLRIRLPAAALSWTPSAAECFERGDRYVWYLGGDHPTDGPQWSEGLLFTVGPRISAEEAERALDILREYLAQNGAEGILPGEGGALALGIPSPGIAAPAPVPTEVSGIKATSDSDTLKSYALWGVALNNETGTAGVLGQATSDSGFVDGVRGETSSYDGFGVSGLSTRTDGHATGVEGYTAAPQGYGGLFSHSSSGGVALYAKAVNDASPDLVLGSNSPSTNDGVMRSDPTDSSSDLLIESNDFLVLRLDRDNNSSGSYFALRDGAGSNILHITEGGAGTLTGSLTISSNLTVYGAVGGTLVSESEAEAICEAAIEEHENTYHPLRVFVTSTTYNGNLGGITGANDKCQDRASAAGLTGTFKAWISTSSVSASANIDNHSSRAYWLPNDAKVADSWSDLTSCSGSCLDHAINRDEFGNPIDATKVWTATTTSGSHKGGTTPGDCSSWTDDYQFSAGWTGLPSHTDSQWTDWGNQGCSLPGHLYCFQN